MVKRFLVYFLVLMQVLSILAKPIIVHAESEGTNLSDEYEKTSSSSLKVFEKLTYEISSGEVIITGYLGSDASVIIPDTISGYPVRTIGEGA